MFREGVGPVRQSASFLPLMLMNLTSLQHARDVVPGLETFFASFYLDEPADVPSAKEALVAFREMTLKLSDEVLQTPLANRLFLHGECEKKAVLLTCSPIFVYVGGRITTKVQSPETFPMERSELQTVSA